MQSRVKELLKEAVARLLQAKGVTDDFLKGNLMKCIDDHFELLEAKPLKRKRSETPTKERMNRIAELWNEHAHAQFRRVKECGGERLRKLGARWSEHPDEQYWVDVIQRINLSAFCSGKNDRKWTASIDWLARPETAIKVLEGVYDDKGGRQESHPAFQYYEGGIK